MAVQRMEFGIVATDASLVDFYAEVFGFETSDPIDGGSGTVYRLQGPGALVKIMVPKRPPTPVPPTDSFVALTGPRYLTVYVDDFEALVERALARGGRMQFGPMEFAPGRHLGVLEDPVGNAIEVVAL